MGQYLLGIDVGTTGTKTLLFTVQGELLSHAYRSYELIAPKVGWCEQCAQDWWNAIVETVRETCAVINDPENVAAISLSLQGGTVVPVDQDMNPLRNAIVWSDGRCEAQFQEFCEQGGSSQYTYEKCGWNMAKGLPALEMRWVRDNEPEIFAKTAMVMSVPDYVAYKMTGKAEVDLSNAGINEFCDIRQEKYDEKLMAFVGITEKQLPKIVHTGDVIGNLTAQAANELGLSEKTILVAGAHDQYAVAVGAGANHTGDVMIGSGTAWVVTAISDAPAFHTGLAQSVASVPGKWGSLLSLSTGGVCLEWLRKEAAGKMQEIGYDRINEEAAKRSAASEGLFFYPFQGIAGKGKRFSRASFAGLDLSHDSFDMISAVMEGVVFQVKWMMEQFDTSALHEIVLSGGASKSEVWTQIIADITGLPVKIPAVADLACVGAAVIAGCGAGIYGSIEEGYQALAVKTHQILPDAERSAKYQEYNQLYRKYAESLYEMYRD